MKNKICKLLAAIFTGLVLMCSNTITSAQEVAQYVLDDIEISKSDFTGIVTIHFRIPVQYISHTPKKFGKEIRIRVDIINNDIRGGISDSTFQSSTDIRDENQNRIHEALTPHQKYSFGLQEVSFDNEFRENYLTLFFSKDVSFEIIQDANYMNMKIIVHDFK